MMFRRWMPTQGFPHAFRELDELQRDMERMFDSLTSFRRLGWAGVFPAVNVTEGRDAIFVRAELPGMRREDLEITVEDNTLTLGGQRDVTGNGDKVNWHRREREGGRFRRSIEISTRIDADHVNARYANGVLTVELPKAPEARPRQIAVQAR